MEIFVPLLFEKTDREIFNLYLFFPFLFNFSPSCSKYFLFSKNNPEILILSVKCLNSRYQGLANNGEIKLYCVILQNLPRSDTVFHKYYVGLKFTFTEFYKKIPFFRFKNMFFKTHFHNFNFLLSFNSFFDQSRRFQTVRPLKKHVDKFIFPLTFPTQSWTFNYKSLKNLLHAFRVKPNLSPTCTKPNHFQPNQFYYLL